MLLTSDRLSVYVGAPGEVYHRMRFDWSGIIAQVTLDGKHTFMTVELPSGDAEPGSLIRPQVPGLPEENTEGLGLMNDFGINKPVGWDEAAVGEPFPKLGVGTLVRTVEGRYRHMLDYPLTRAEIRAEQDDTGITFVTEPLPCNGYAVRIVKKVFVEGTVLSIRTTMANMGEKAIHTNEYNHNFVAIDDLPVDLGLSVEYPAAPVVDTEKHPLLSVEGNRVVFKGIPSVYSYGLAEIPHEAGVRYILRDERAGVGMKESGDFPLADLSTWGKEHTVCPESFINIDLEPGESMTWTRSWEFFDL